MAIVINGSTGISATESSTVLGDNAVETADIAAGAVTAAKLASGAAASNLGTGNVTAAMLASTLDLTGKTVTLPSGTGGKVLQVVSYTKTNTNSTTSTSPVDTGLEVTLTPSSTSNKILLFANVNWSRDVDKRAYFRFTRNGTAIALGDANTGHEATFAIVSRAGDSYIIHTLSGSYLDAPSSTSSITYKLQWWVEANTAYLNRPATIDANGANTVSTITAMEIAA